VRFLALDTDYPDFLKWLYAEHSGLEKRPYEEQIHVRMESLYGQVGLCSRALNSLGHEANEIYVNNEYLQTAWAKAHGLKISSGPQWQFRLRRGIVPWVSRGQQPRWFTDILGAQIKHYKPDVLLNLAMNAVSSRFLQEMKPYIGLLVGQIAAPVPQDQNWRTYDLVISSLPNLVEYFRSLSVPSELNRLAFEPAVLSRLKRDEPEVPVSFVGSFHRAHATRVSFLEHLCSSLELEVWGNGLSGLRRDSPVHSRFVGAAWGVAMYQILRRSKMTLNHHVDIADSYANNLRLYEATGVGTLLVTDWKRNLHEMFEVGKEVVAYRTAEECVKLIRYYLEHEEERSQIARAGQERTLREHTYAHRMQQLLGIVSKHL
jgi:spore maturation protein CgeB